MALTLQERSKLLNDMSTVDIYNNSILVTPLAKIKTMLGKLAGEITQGTLLRSEIPDINVHNPSDAQLIEWCNRAQSNSGMGGNMANSVISYASWDTDGAETTDAVIRTTCLNCIASYAKKI